MKLETIKPLNEGKIKDWVKALDKKLGQKIDAVAARYFAKKVVTQGLADMTTEELGDDIGFMKPESVKAFMRSLNIYLDNEPEGEYANEVRHVLPAIERNHKKWQKMFAHVGMGEE